jgi:hypothetical protein
VLDSPEDLDVDLYREITEWHESVACDSQLLFVLIGEFIVVLKLYFLE